MPSPRAETADRIRRRVLQLRARGRTLSAIAYFVQRSRRRVVQILAEERARYEAEQDRDAS